jgi:TatD DNase family protein
MQLIDTHTHLYLKEFDADRDEIVDRARTNGISKLLMPNIDVESVNQMLTVQERYPGNCYSMLGLHPTSVKGDYITHVETLENLFNANKYIAIGEIGIDLYWDKTFLSEQIIAFRRQIKFALKHDLPVVVHARDSFPEVFAVLEEFSGENLKGVLHAFTGDMVQAERAIKMGFFLGIGGIVTFKSSGLDKVVKEVGITNLILETDSPYLAPVPHRGKRNESSYLRLINSKIAEILDMDEEKTASVTCSNSTALFNI